MEKKIDRIDLYLGPLMKQDLQDAAMAADRKVSDYIRHVLVLHLYGIKGASTQDCNGVIQGEARQAE